MPPWAPCLPGKGRLRRIAPDGQDDKTDRASNRPARSPAPRSLFRNFTLGWPPEPREPVTRPMWFVPQNCTHSCWTSREPLAGGGESPALMNESTSMSSSFPCHNTVPFARASPSDRSNSVSRDALPFGLRNCAVPRCDKPGPIRTGRLARPGLHANDCPVRCQRAIFKHEVGNKTPSGDLCRFQLDRGSTGSDRALRKRNQPAAQLRFECAAAGDQHAAVEQANRPLGGE